MSRWYSSCYWQQVLESKEVHAMDTDLCSSKSNCAHLGHHILLCQPTPHCTTNTTLHHRHFRHRHSSLRWYLSEDHIIFFWMCFQLIIFVCICCQHIQIQHFKKNNQCIKIQLVFLEVYFLSSVLNTCSGGTNCLISQLILIYCPNWKIPNEA